MTIAIDTREKYGWKFSSRPVVIERRALPAGDYAAAVGGAVAAVIERKTLENLASSLSDGGLAFQMQRLAEVARAAIVVGGRLPGSLSDSAGPWILARRHAGTPGCPIPRDSDRVRWFAAVRRGVGVPLSRRGGWRLSVDSGIYSLVG